MFCKPNETGKSTGFDVLQALFFANQRSQTKQIKSLKPHAGGAPEVTVEIETGEDRVRIEKRWASSAHARMWQDERISTWMSHPRHGSLPGATLDAFVDIACDTDGPSVVEDGAAAFGYISNRCLQNGIQGWA